MKNYVRKLMPHFILLFIRRMTVIRKVVGQHLHQIRRELKYSNSVVYDKTSRLSGLLVTSHVLEKGITMPERRLGFGKERVLSIIEQCKSCIQDYGSDHVEIQAALSDLVQYRNLHKEENFDLPDDIVKGIDNLQKELCLKDSNCFTTRKDSFFKKVECFEDFAWQRHSVRWYSGDVVETETIKKAIKLAQSAPSACNRQSVRVRIIEDPNQIGIISNSIQNGCRGFGDKANKWLLITSDQRCWGANETSLAYVDGGIFVMNLLYALHYYGVAACPLNALLDSKKERKLQALLKYNVSELPILFIAVGSMPDELMIAKSRRLNTEDII
jgi:hypothetical protein